MPTQLDRAYLATLPTPLDERPLPAVAAPVPALQLLVMGFDPIEQRLLQGTVRLSQRRSPRLVLLDESAAESADVVLIDGGNPASMHWARRQPWLARKTVIWVDTVTAAPGHTTMRRPVHWPVLPMLLARALEQGVPRPGAATPTDDDATSTPFAAASAVQDAGERAGADLPPFATAPTPQPVLVVDDSLAVRAHLRSLLEGRGIAVTLVESAEAGIEAASATRFGCILMDVLMPGIDGYEACRRIKAASRAARQRTPIVMLTSKSSPFDRIRGKMAGCDAYLTKPVDATVLHTVLAPFIAPRTGAPATGSPARPTPRALAPARPDAGESLAPLRAGPPT